MQPGERQPLVGGEADDATQATETVTRQIDIDAPVDEVWEAISTDEGRERWLEPDPDRVVVVEHHEQPRRLAWWWWSGDEPARHVEISIRPLHDGSRVTVTESAPASFPVSRMAAACAADLVAA